VPEALATKLAEGGAVVFASAAALTLGSFSVPVYEIYKVGQPVHWLDGMDLLRGVGFEGSCVVIPHYDNAEGGTHDTRFCYLGERRLAAMEAMLPADAWVLGIDEHTALIVDLDARSATVTGRGVLTVRRRGVSRVFAAGERIGLDTLLAAAEGSATAARQGPAPAAATDGAGASSPGPAPPARSPLLAEVARMEHAFEAAIAARRAGEATEAILHLDRIIAEWAADSLQSDEPDRARAVLHSLVHRLGEAAAGGLRDPREVLAPLVETLIALRADLRTARAWDLADRVRDRLIAARIEVRDTPGGTVWDLKP
jgi:hypothetical protein